MRSRLLLPIACLLPLLSIGQYYITGKIVDEEKHPIAAVKMRLQKGSTLLQNGSSGEFGLPSFFKKDSVTCFLSGYDTVHTMVFAGIYNTIVMKATTITKEQQTHRLSSLTNNLLADPAYIRQVNDETYSSTVENDFVDAQKFPKSGFALNVNKASYSNVRRFINNQTTTPKDAVRIEEMLNYFSLSCTPPPIDNDVFRIDSRISSCPWNTESVLLFLNVQAKKIALQNVPPSNLVFLIDDSGSMDLPNRLPLLKAGFKLLVNNLRAVDTVTIVTYGGSPGIMLAPTGGANKQAIIEAIEGLSPAGATPGSGGLKLAYDMAKNNFIPGGNNRVILATDGDFNVGQVNEKELENLIVSYRNSGILLTCLGVGMGNYKDSKLEVLAKFGNGNFAYLDNEREAEKVLVTEFSQTLVSIAENVFINIEFDPQYISQYRLIGFDNKQDAIVNKNSVLAGGEVGSGHSLMAMVEIKMNKQLILDVAANPDAILGNITLQYKEPANKTPQTINHAISLNYQAFETINTPLQFATAIAMFGQLLKQSKFATGYNFNMVQSIANAAASSSDLLQQEFLKLIDAAAKIYEKENGKKRKKRKDE